MLFLASKVPEFTQLVATFIVYASLAFAPAVKVAPVLFVIEPAVKFPPSVILPLFIKLCERVQASFRIRVAVEAVSSDFKLSLPFAVAVSEFSLIDPSSSSIVEPNVMVLIDENVVLDVIVTAPE